MTDRELMQQALEALDSDNPDIQLRTSIALRARLAQSSEMDEAIAAGDGTLHGAIDYWQERALKAEARLAQKPEQAEPVQPNEILFAVEIPEGYEDTHPELLGEDAFSGKGWVRWRVVPTDEPNAEPTRNAVISFLLGEAPLDGVWFDEPHPTYPGRFWWRAYLRHLTTPSDEGVCDGCSICNSDDYVPISSDGRSVFIDGVGMVPLAFEHKPSAEPVDLQDIEQYRMQMAGICTAALGYWKDGDSVHPDYDTPALREVAELYAKYAKLAAQPKRTPLTDEEMRECAQAMDAEPLAEGWDELIKFARAIERKHGIGETK